MRRVRGLLAVPRGTGNLDQKVSLMGLFPLPSPSFDADRDRDAKSVSHRDLAVTMASSDAHRAAAPSSPSPSQLLASADKALAFLRSATQPPVWPPAKPDIAYVFKLPAAYESMECVEEGRAVFAELLRPHLPDGGVHSDNPAYRFAYPHYPYVLRYIPTSHRWVGSLLMT